MEKPIWRWRERLFVLAAILPGLLFSLYLLLHAHRVNGGIDGFPLDDPWIHLTYARNLHDAHVFSYFPGESATQGSTSPLYTFLLALGFTFTQNEKVLSYVLGLFFHGCFLAALWSWARVALAGMGDRHGGKIWAALAVLLVGLDNRIGILSVSGMETSLFLFLTAMTFWARHRRSYWAMSIAGGLAIWVRPDGLILLAILALGTVAEKLRPPTEHPFKESPSKEQPSKEQQTPPPVPTVSTAGQSVVTPAGSKRSPGPVWLRRTDVAVGLPIALSFLIYAIFNLALGGSILPNTFAAKAAYYHGNSREFFLLSDVRETFLTGAWIVLTPFSLIAACMEAVCWFRRRPGTLRAETGWAVALPLAYFVLLPFSHRFGRYLVPALPAVALLSFRGMMQFTAWIRPLVTSKERPTKAKSPRANVPTRSFAWGTPAGLFAGLLLLAALVLQTRAAAQGVSLYTELCSYHYARHERTGRWLAENTPSNAVIATHDVGAIAYYSRRKVVDMVGVVLPEVVAHLNRGDYTSYLQDLFRRKQVTHVAVLRNWFEVVNVDPLFVADPHPEIMEVFPWVAGKTHLMPSEASDLNRLAADQIRAANYPAAQAYLEQSVSLDPSSSRTWLLLGVCRELAGQISEAETAYRQVVSLFPDSPEGLLRLATVLTIQGRPQEALPFAQQLVRLRPDMPGAAELQNQLVERTKPSGR